MLGFWMGKDSKDHPLGERGATGGPGFAESGARNWVHSAATVLAFLQKERGLLQPGHRFAPIFRDDVLERLSPANAKAPQVQMVAAAPARTDVGERVPTLRTIEAIVSGSADEPEAARHP